MKNTMRPSTRDADDSEFPHTGFTSDIWELTYLSLVGIADYRLR